MYISAGVTVKVYFNGKKGKLDRFFFAWLTCILVATKENLTGFSTGLTGRSKTLDPTGFHL